MNNCSPRTFVRGLKIVAANWVERKIAAIKNGNVFQLFTPWMVVWTPVVFLFSYPILPDNGHVPIFGLTVVTGFFSAALALCFGMITVAVWVCTNMVKSQLKEICDVGAQASSEAEKSDSQQ